MGRVRKDDSATSKGLPQDHDWLFSQRAFYAEFAPPRDSKVVDHLYVMKDRGIMTADRCAFASPFMEIAFSFREPLEETGRSTRIVVLQPAFGHRRKSRTFHGWVFGLRVHPLACRLASAETSSFTNCQKRLAQEIRKGPSPSNILGILDRLCRDLAPQHSVRSRGLIHSLERPRADVTSLAALSGQSSRTLQRRIKASTGLSPKRFLALGRFRYAVQEVSAPNASLSAVAGDLGFADQAHLTREFRRHAGLTPGAFQRAWRGSRGQAVRFVQDAQAPTRLRIAVWAQG
jgi:AraC-like DNA-binding protein